MLPLTPRELKLIEQLPAPPSSAEIRATNIWIVEWLGQEERRTGKDLFEWANQRRPGWAALRACSSKREVLDAIAEATDVAQRTPLRPVLHLETHGCKAGLTGGTSSGDLLRWDELTDSLQALNVATKCNLVVVVAACYGYGAVISLSKGPRAPAMAIVGPAEEIMPSDLFEGTKELYRRWMDADANLQVAAVSATQQASNVSFVVEPFAMLAYEVLTEHWVVSLRPDEQEARRASLLAQMLDPSDADMLARMEDCFPLPPGDVLQRIWDEMFMIDLYPDNRDRFGLDVNQIRRMLIAPRPA